MGLTPIQVLLVEDSPADIRLTQEALRDGKFVNQLYVARDGDEALNFLHQRGEFASAPRPDLVILDLNLPKRDGKEVLADLKNDMSLKTIPVAILTTSARGTRHRRELRTRRELLPHQTS